jgi:hypothetical protein
VYIHLHQQSADCITVHARNPLPTANRTAFNEVVDHGKLFLWLEPIHGEPLPVAAGFT